MEKKEYIEILCFSDGKSFIIEEQKNSSDCVINVGNDVVEGFRFYKKDINGKKINYSNWVYFGKEVSIEEAKKLLEKDSKYDTFLENASNNDLKICITKKGNPKVLEVGDKTYSTYLKEFKEKYENLIQYCNSQGLEEEKNKYIKKMNEIFEITEKRKTY